MDTVSHCHNAKSFKSMGIADLANCFHIPVKQSPSYAHAFEGYYTFVNRLLDHQWWGVPGERSRNGKVPTLVLKLPRSVSRPQSLIDLADTVFYTRGMVMFVALAVTRVVFRLF